MNHDNLYSLTSLFNQKLFRVPDYQRGYAWKKSQLDDFWDDLNTVSFDNNHYAGMLTFEKIENVHNSDWNNDKWIIDSRGFTPYYVVDGQQRLTTTVILIQSILEAAINLEVSDLNESTLEYLRNKYVIAENPSKISRTYIFSYQKTNNNCAFLEESILNISNDLEQVSTESVYTSNLSNAKKYFAEKLKNLDVKTIETILKKLTQNFKFSTHVVSTDFDVCLTFETMNNRGKPLSHLELLKNRLIYLTTLLVNDKNDSQQIRNKINDCWSDIYRYLGQDNDTLSDDLFLFNHYTLYYGFQNDLKSKHNIRYGLVYHEIDNPFNEAILNVTFSRKRISSENDRISISEIQNYVENIKKNVRLWSYIFHPQQSSYNSNLKKILEQIKRLNLGNDVYLLIFSILCQGYTESELENILTLIERHSFLNLLVPFVEYKDHKSFKELAIELFESTITLDNVVTEIKKYISSILTFKDLKSSLTYRFTRNGYYGWKPVYHVLYEYEQYLHSKSKNKTAKVTWSTKGIDSKDFESIEHIMPQTLKDVYWKENFKDYDTSQKNSLKNTLGNLVCVSRPKNSKLSNKAFPIKKSLPDDNFGYMYGSYSEIELSEYKNWTSKEILERGLKILSFVEERWDIKLGNKEDKTKILGLSFLLNNKDIVKAID